MELIKKITRNTKYALLSVAGSLFILFLILHLAIGRGLILGITNGSSMSLPTQVNATTNSNFTVPINLNPNGQNVVGADVQITFPTENLQLISASAGALPTTVTFVPSLAQAVATANDTGKLSFSMLTYDQANNKVTNAITGTTSQPIVNLTFNPRSAGVAGVNWLFSPNSSRDANVAIANSAQDALTLVTNMTVNISNPTPTTTPTPTPTQTPDQPQTFENQGFELGNTNSWSQTGATITESNPHSGKYSASINANNSKISKQINSLLKANVQYTFKTWVSVTKKGTSWGSPSFRLSKFEDLGSSDFGKNDTTNSINGWKELKVTKKFTASELSNPIYIGVKNFGFNGTVSVDDFSIVEESGTAPTPTTPVATPTPTPTPSATSVTQQLTVNATVGNQDGTAYTTSSTWVGVGQNISSSYTTLRFANVTIPANAKINSAKLELKSTSEQWINLSFNVKGDNSANSTAFSSSSLPSSRNLTSQEISYSKDEKWTSGSWIYLDDASTVVSAITSKSDWKSGNSISLIAKGAGQAYGRKYINGARITISYTTQ